MLVQHQEIYRRKIALPLIILRSFFPLGLVSCFLFFIAGLSTIGYVVAIMVIFSSFIRIIDVIISKQKIEVKKYYFFGLIPIQFSFRKRKAPRIRLVRELDHIYMADAPLFHLPLYLLTLLFIRVKMLTLSFQYINCAKKKLWERITISEREFQLISDNHLNNV